MKKIFEIIRKGYTKFMFVIMIFQLEFLNLENGVNNLLSREFSGGSVARTQNLHCQGLTSIPGQGTKTLKAAGHGQKIIIVIIILSNRLP